MSTSWQAVREKVLKKLSQRQWQAGEAIPGEAELARQYGCARATVNRALQSLADEGLLVRKRKGGTRVARLPVRKATLEIPITRLEIENSGAQHSYRLISRRKGALPILHSGDNGECDDYLRVRSVHLADNKPWVYEDRWINAGLIPEVHQVDFSKHNANEWLLEHVFFTRGKLDFSIGRTSAAACKHLNVTRGRELFTSQRKTWQHKRMVTYVNLVYAPGYQFSMTI